MTTIKTNVTQLPVTQLGGARYQPTAGARPQVPPMPRINHPGNAHFVPAGFSPKPIPVPARPTVSETVSVPTVTAQQNTMTSDQVRGYLMDLIIGASPGSELPARATATPPAKKVVAPAKEGATEAQVQKVIESNAVICTVETNSKLGLHMVIRNPFSRAFNRAMWAGTKLDTFDAADKCRRIPLELKDVAFVAIRECFKGKLLICDDADGRKMSLID